MEDITIRAYAFEELDEAAQERVFCAWRDSSALAELYYREVEDIDAALVSFIELIGYNPTPTRGAHYSGWYRYGSNDDYIGFDSVDFYEAVERCYEVDDYAGVGDCFGYDIAQAWNSGVKWLSHLKDEAIRAEQVEAAAEPDSEGRRLECYGTIEAQAAYCSWFEKMLADVAGAYHRMVDEAFSYYYCAEGAREIWDSGEYDIETDGRWYDSDGRDITYLVDTYMGRC